MHIWIYFEKELLRRSAEFRLKPKSSDKNVHGIEESLNVLMI